MNEKYNFSPHWQRVANGKRNRKYIKVLENEERTILDNIDNILMEILHFLEKLYVSPPRESWRLEV